MSERQPGNNGDVSPRSLGDGRGDSSSGIVYEPKSVPPQEKPAEPPQDGGDAAPAEPPKSQ